MPPEPPPPDPAPAPAPAAPATEPAPPPVAPPPAAASPAAPAPSPVPAAPAPLPPAPPPGPSPGQLSAIRERIGQANVQTAEIMAHLSALDAQVFQTNQTIADGERQVVALRARIQESEADVLRLEAVRDDLKKLWNKRARRIYKDTPGNAWAPLFSVQTWSEFGRLKKVWRSIAAGHTRLVAASAQIKEQLLDEKTDLLEATRKLERQNEELTAARERLRRTRQSRTASLGQLRLAIGQAMAAEQAALAADAVGMRIPHLCNPGSDSQNQKLADLLDWYAPAAGPEPFLHPKMTPTSIILPAQASWYGPTFEGCRASSGATFRSNQMTAASLTLPFGTLLKVSNVDKAVIVVITDRGPYVPGRDLDLSQAAAEAIGLKGVGPVSMEIVLPTQPSPPFP